MKKTVAALLAGVLSVSVLFALEVDRTEINPGSAGDAITFVNYTGPNTVISSAAEITGIGSDLGKLIKDSGSASAGDKTRYYVIHAVDAATAKGFDADILILGEGAGVDHIDNIRRIMAGYLSAAYGYSLKDAATLSTFITVYNAVYRGKMDVFTARYKTAVTKNLSADKVGLSVRYDEWAGKSQIIIPLSEPRLAGTISAIDTTSLTDKAVVDKIKEDTANGTETRKSMTDLKDRESTAAQTRADAAQTDAAAARTDVATKQAEAQTAKTEAQTAKAEADKAAAAAKANPQDAVAQVKAAETAQKAEDKQAAAEKKTAEAAMAQDTVAKKEEAAKSDQTLADTKQKEARTERKEIAADVQKAIDKTDAAAKSAADAALASATPAFAIRIVDEKNLLGELVLVNLNDGKILKTSSLNAIRGRTLIDTGSGLIAIAGKKGGNAAIRLVLVDAATLEVSKQGIDAIAEQSMLVSNGNDYYAIIENDNGKFSLGRFDKNLEAKAKSAIEVKAASAITVTAKGVIVQDKSGAIKLLRATDLVDVSK